MINITGKAYDILKRMHHFYHPENVDTDISIFADIFGRVLEDAEKNIYNMLFSHHVKTASKYGSSGYMDGQEQKEDLDKIFAMYLEFLGGTSFLSEVNNLFVIGSIDTQAAVNTLLNRSDELADYLKGQFSAQTWELIVKYNKQSDDSYNRQILIKSVEKALIKEFNKLLDIKDIYTKDRFTSTSSSDYQNLKAKLKENTQVLNRILIENEFPLEIEKSFATYRERLLELISVLRQGPSTIDGIKEITAANLGITGQSSAAEKARDMIQIEEFIPEPISLFHSNVSAYKKLEIVNTNPHADQIQIKIGLLDFLKPIKKITKIELKNIDSGQSVIIDFEDTKQVKPGDIIEIKKSSIFINGVLFSKIEGIPSLLPGSSSWSFNIEFDVTEAAFDSEKELFGNTFFWSGGACGIDGARMQAIFDSDQGIFDETSFLLGSAYGFGDTRTTAIFDSENKGFEKGAYLFEKDIAEMDIQTVKITPAVFTVTVPWYIEGITDKFAETQDHPRHRILSLINKVKAAGVSSFISYRQPFFETQDHFDSIQQIKMAGPALSEAHEMQDSLKIYAQHRLADTHDIKDCLNVQGVFNHSNLGEFYVFAPSERS